MIIQNVLMRQSTEAAQIVLIPVATKEDAVPPAGGM